MTPSRSLLAGAALLACVLPGCGTSTAVEQPPGPVLYVDLKTRETFELPPQPETPARHPVTGARTLMPGLYCAQCAAWYPSPPVEVLQRNPTARLCPKHRSPLEAKGSP